MTDKKFYCPVDTDKPKADRMSGKIPQWWLKFSNLWKRDKIQIIFMPVRLLGKFMLLSYPDSMEDSQSGIYCSQETNICTWSVCFKLQIFKVTGQPEASHGHSSLEELERLRRWGNENDSMDTVSNLQLIFNRCDDPLFVIERKVCISTQGRERICWEPYI